jgi:mRNA-degrading endonuclease YafQ of YafQ-DinJ toxin-antitoxin module
MNIRRTSKFKKDFKKLSRIPGLAEELAGVLRVLSAGALLDARYQSKRVGGSRIGDWFENLHGNQHGESKDTSLKINCF